ncbi:MAG TPA: efflux RND transporter periplasmic adaptor subunit [Candidatus Polarisedimenticolaceae bacterium]|nr:efflux RND transporter periplasmic adaptor subunit [Candidatus Polarisedimenticolaceae bacterium]
MKKVVTILIGLVALSLFAGTIFYLYSKSQEQPVTYRTESPSVTDIVYKTVATGSVVPRKEVEIKPQVSGVVDELFVEAGDRVEAGARIARIRIIPDMVNLANAETRVNRARINLENAEIDIERSRRLASEGVVARTELQQFELAYDSAKEELAASVDNLELIKKGTRAKAGESTNTLVEATIEGMVLEVPVEVGDSVIEANTFNEGTTIATIADMDELIFEGLVDESEVGKIRPGMELLLTIGAIEGKTFKATLEHIAPKGVEENGAIQFEIRAALAQQDGAFVRANYSANADIVLDRRDEVLAISEGLLQFDGDVTYVEVETADQQFERREIETGLSDGIQIEVVGGLTADDRVKDPNSAG